MKISTRNHSISSLHLIFNKLVSRLDHKDRNFIHVFCLWLWQVVQRGRKVNQKIILEFCCCCCCSVRKWERKKRRGERREERRGEGERNPNSETGKKKKKKKKTKKTKKKKEKEEKKLAPPTTLIKSEGHQLFNVGKRGALRLSPTTMKHLQIDDYYGIGWIRSCWACC